MKSEKKVVIIGAGFGGLEAAKKLGSAGVNLTVIDRSNHHLFQPLLYQVATAGLSPADIAAPIRSILKKNASTEVAMDEVIGIDTVNKKVLLKEEHLGVPFDYLIIATGARHGYFNHPEWEAFAPGLKSIADATTIRRNILSAFESAELEKTEMKSAFLTFVIVGGGPTGVEMAGAIAELAKKALASDFRHINSSDIRVVLIEAGERLLSTFPPKLSLDALHALQKLGVDVLLSSRVAEINSEGVTIGPDLIKAKTVIWAAGVSASPAGKWLGVPVDSAGRVKVGDDLSLELFPDIFVIGDTAAKMQNGILLPGVSSVAMQEGRYVAKVILKRLSGESKPGPFYYFDKGSMATVGRSFAVAQVGKFLISGFLAWLLWLTIHIYYLIGYRNRVLVMIQWILAYVTFQRGARLIVEPREK